MRFLSGMKDTIIQIIILVGCGLFAALVLHFLYPSLLKMILDWLGSVPITSDMLKASSSMAADMVDLFEAAGDTGGGAVIINCISDYIMILGASLYEVFMITLWIKTFEEIDTLVGLNDGFKILFPVIGIVISYGIITAIANVPIDLNGRIGLMAFSAMVWLIVTVLACVFTLLRQGAPVGPWDVIRPILIGYLMAGFHALFGSYMLFWGCCIFNFSRYGVKSFSGFLALIILPTLIMILFFLVQYLLYFIEHSLIEVLQPVKVWGRQRRRLLPRFKKFYK